MIEDTKNVLTEFCDKLYLLILEAFICLLDIIPRQILVKRKRTFLKSVPVAYTRNVMLGMHAIAVSSDSFLILS